MKTINYRDLHNDEVVKGLEIGDQILLAPDSIRSTKVLLDILKEAIELAKI